MVLLVARNLSQVVGAQTLFSGLNLDIDRGDKIGIVGPNGSGKTTLLKTLARVLTPASGRVQLHVDVHVVWQEFPVQDKELIGYDFLHKFSVRQPMEPIAQELGLDVELLNKPVSQLSGGEQTKLQLLAMAVCEPVLIAADEPTNNLDIQGIEWWEEFLSEHKGGAIVVSHDRYLLDRAVTEIVEIADGRSRHYAGNYRFYEREKELELERTWAEYGDYQQKRRQLQAAIQDKKVFAARDSKPRKIRDSSWKAAKAYHGAKAAQMARSARALEKRLEQMPGREKPVEREDVRVEFDAGEKASPVLCRATDLSVTMGGRRIFKDASFVIKYGDRIGLVGPNGAGKSTLARIITGECEGYEGELSVSSAAMIGSFAQRWTGYDPERTLLDELMAAGASRNQAHRLLAQLLFSREDVFKRPTELSRGELVRFQIACLMVAKHNLLILDEPTNHLDILARKAIEQAVSGFAGALLMVSHDRYLINEVADTTWELNDVLRVYAGKYEDVVANRKRTEEVEDNEDEMVLRLRLAQISGELADADEDRKTELEREFIQLSRRLRD